MLTAAEPNLAYFEDLVGRLDVGIEDVSAATGQCSRCRAHGHATSSRR